MGGIYREMTQKCRVNSEERPKNMVYKAGLSTKLYIIYNVKAATVAFIKFSCNTKTEIMKFTQKWLYAVPVLIISR
jgi:hypothetical protein